MKLLSTFRTRESSIYGHWEHFRASRQTFRGPFQRERQRYLTQCSFPWKGSIYLLNLHLNYIKPRNTCYHHRLTQVFPSWRSASEGRLRTLHFLTFAGIRIVYGFISLRRILTLEEVVKDTSYICTILLLYAMALYLFAGVIAFSTKRMTRAAEGFAANVPMIIMTSVSDDWLH